MGIWKRPLCRIAAGFLLGILLGAWGCAWYLAAAVILLPGVCAIAIWMGGAFRHRAVYMAVSLFAVVVSVLLGRWRYLGQEQFREAYLSRLEDGMELTVQGELYQKESKNGQYIYYLTSCKAGMSNGDAAGKTVVSCNHIMVYADSDDYQIGEILVLNGTVELWKSASNEGNFDAKAYYLAQQTDFKLKDSQVLSVHGSANWVKEWLYGLRLRLGEVYEKCMGSADGGVLAAMALGEKSLLDSGIKETYQRTGISHILAISGLHISVIGMTVYRLLRRLGAGFRGAGLLSAGLLYCYGVMVGMGVSVSRAVLMFGIMLLAQALGRSYDSLSALSAAALWLLWKNPGLLFYAGFLLSFGAAFGVVCIGRFLAAPEEKGEQRKEKKDGTGRAIFHKLRESFFISVSIQLVTIPLTAWFYYEIPVYALPVNLVVLPLAAPLLYLGIAGGILGIFSEGAAAIVLYPCHFILLWYEKVCGFCGLLPGAVFISGQPQWWKMAAYYVLLAVAAGLAAGTKERRSYWQMPLTGVILLAFLLFRPVGGFEIDILDVGQGDGIFIRSESGDTLFIDGGSSNVSRVGEYRILPFLKAKGIRKIDYWAVTHTDQDHISGLEEILESDYPVKNLLVSADIVRDAGFEKLTELAEGHGTAILFVQKGDVLHLGEARAEFIAPERGAAGEDKNAASLVFYYKEGAFCGLFTGDIGEKEERLLLEGGETERVDFYKAAHHGSGGSNSAEYLKALSPAVSVVSCARYNSYGHPAQSAVEHMRQAGSEIFYTMYGGQICVTLDGDQIVVEKYLQPLDVFRCPVVE